MTHTPAVEVQIPDQTLQSLEATVSGNELATVPQSS